MPEDEAQALRERILKEQAGPSAAAPGTFEAPDYGRGRGRREDPDRPVDGGPITGPASGPPAGPTPGEDTAEGTAPASGATEGRFARPRYGRHAGRPDASRHKSGPDANPDAATGPSGEPDTEKPDRNDPA